MTLEQAFMDGHRSRDEEVAAKDAEIAKLRSRCCAICNDTGYLDDAQAWDCDQENSECPYCPHRVDELLEEIAALREAIKDLKYANAMLTAENKSLEDAVFFMEGGLHEADSWRKHPTVLRVMEERKP